MQEFIPLSPRPRLGEAGDFYASAYLTALFGELFAHQFEEMWQARMSGRDQRQLRTFLLEMGQQLKVLVQHKGVGQVRLSGLTFSELLG
jgi:SAM-dependent MidA family methyltransferase